ncbi:MAG TPA: ABC-type transport auxiliary lipoprotein family protein [Rhizomicrobium sp.]|jgi:cholesterol transport system auxiliary component|nr:ABC-type transport auxiliary lipoprotein family protein [Rhizomicrobium sp.]
MNSSFGLGKHPRRILPMLAFAMTAGCGSLLGPSNPPPQIYRLSPEIASQPGGTSVPWQLAVARPDATQTLDTDRIALLRGPLMDYYADAQWNDSAPRLVQSLLVEAFDSSGRVQAAARDSASLRADVTLASDLRDFEAQYDSANPAPLVVIDIEAKLLDARGQVIASVDSRQTARASQNNVASVVAAFDQAMAAALSQIVGWTLQATPR